MKIGKIILLSALFLGVRAVVKKEKNTTSGGSSAGGKTNDPMTPEEIAELKKRLERQKLLQSICKNINIAKENELNGLAGTEKVSRAEVESFLKEFNTKVRFFGITVYDREINSNTMEYLNFNDNDVADTIKKLNADNFIEKIKDKNFVGSDLYVFGITIKNKEIYIKISKGYVNKKALCISFHFPKYPIKYYNYV